MAQDKTIFPLLVTEAERLFLDHASTAAGLSRAGLLRALLYQHVATRELKRETMRGVKTSEE